MEGQQKQFYLETQEAVSLAIEHLQARTRSQISVMAAMALATGMNIRVLDGLYKKQMIVDTYMWWAAVS